MRDQVVSSAYLFGINTNTKSDQYRIKSFLDGLKRIFLSPNILNFIRINDEEDKAQHNKKDLISKIEIDINTEVGPHNSFVHCHCYVVIYHYTNLTLVGKDIQQYFANKYRIPVTVSPPKIQSDSKIHYIRYLQKQRKSRIPLTIQSRIVPEEGQPQTYYYTFKMVP
jgi:hypothetical protein